MKTTLYRDNTTLRWILFEDRVAPCHQRQLPDGVDRCVCMLHPARTTIDGVSYMASCRTAISRGQRRVFESHARQMEQDDRFVSDVLTAQSCENLLHDDAEPNASSDIMIVSDIDLLPSRLRNISLRVIVCSQSHLHNHHRHQTASFVPLMPHESQTPHFDDCIPRCLGGFVSC